MTLNVDPNIDDSFYRYKLHKPIVVIEGKNQNSRTILKNIDEISKDIFSRSEHLIKFISLKKGTRYIISEDKIMIKAILSQEETLKLIYEFVENYVLCKMCANPETERKIIGDNFVIKCLSCGHIYEGLAKNDQIKIFGKK